MPTKMVNLTGFPLMLKGVMLEARRKKARVSSRMDQVDAFVINNIEIPVLEVTEQQVLNLPPPAPDTIYIVNGITASHANLVDGREDVYTVGRVTSKVGDPFIKADALLKIREAEDE